MHKPRMGKQTEGTRTPYEKHIERYRYPVSNTYLTVRQYQIMQAYCDGKTVKEIANDLGVTDHTIGGHLYVAKIRLGAATLHQAIAIFAASEAEKRIKAA